MMGHKIFVVNQRASIMFRNFLDARRELRNTVDNMRIN